MTRQFTLLDRTWVLALLAACMAIPLLWPTIPPLTDLPGHMGRYAIQLDGGRTPFLAENFRFVWGLTGNLGVDLLIVPMAPIFGLEFAVKLIAMLIPVIGAFGIFLVARQVHGKVPPTTLFALPFLYGHPFTFGFLNFSLSMALALNALALWIWLANLGRFKLRFILFVPLSCTLWMIHSFGWGFLGLLTFAAEVGRAREAKTPFLEAVWKSSLHCLCQTLPIVAILVWRSNAAASGTGDWFNMDAKLLWLAKSLRDRWLWFDIGSLLLVIIVFCHAFWSPSKRFAPALALGALILLAAFLVLPRVIFSSAYADMRLTPYIFIVAITALKPFQSLESRSAKVFAVVAALFLTARLVGNTASFYFYGTRQAEALTALDHLPPHSRVVAFVRDACDNPWSSARLEHVPSIGIVRRQSFVNDQWAVDGAQMMRITKSDAPGFVEDPSQFVSSADCAVSGRPRIAKQLRYFPRRAFDYVWLIDLPGIDQSSLSGFTLVWTNGKDSLYRIGELPEPGLS